MDKGHALSSNQKSSTLDGRNATLRPFRFILRISAQRYSNSEWTADHPLDLFRFIDERFPGGVR
jgi:hypothetical protein